MTNVHSTNETGNFVLVFTCFGIVFFKNCHFRYNQNFKGLYCICHRPYPDPEDTVPDEMIQCIVCEDWLHGRHLLKGVDKLPKDENYSEMICFECFEKKRCILKHYVGLSVTTVTKAESKDKDVKVDEAGDINNLRLVKNCFERFSVLL